MDRHSHVLQFLIQGCKILAHKVCIPIHSLCTKPHGLVLCPPEECLWPNRMTPDCWPLKINNPEPVPEACPHDLPPPLTLKTCSHREPPVFWQRSGAFMWLSATEGDDQLLPWQLSCYSSIWAQRVHRGGYPGPNYRTTSRRRLTDALLRLPRSVKAVDGLMG